MRRPPSGRPTSSRPRVSVVGVGANIWPFHQRAIEAEGYHVVAVYDVDHARACTAAREIGAPVAGTLDKLLAVDTDLVLILAPHPQHHALARAALGAGRHVLVEKPVAVTVEQARDLVATARAADRLLGVCFQQRTRTELVRARRLVVEGALGRLQRIDLIGAWPRRTSYFATAPWRGTWHGEGGGILINQGQHDLDALCFLVGQPVEVTAVTTNSIHPIETEDTAAALVRWADGALGNIHLSSAELDVPQRIEITGTHGRLRVQPGQLEVIHNDVDFRDYAVSDGDPYEGPKASPLPVFYGSGGRHEQIYANFRDAMTTGAKLTASGESAALTLEVAAAIMMSGRERTTVGLPLSEGRHTAFLEDMSTAPAR